MLAEIMKVAQTSAERLAERIVDQFTVVPALRAQIAAERVFERIVRHIIDVP